MNRCLSLSERIAASPSQVRTNRRVRYCVMCYRPGRAGDTLLCYRVNKASATRICVLLQLRAGRMSGNEDAIYYVERREIPNAA